MNILFFLTPKDAVEYVFSDFSVRQALEKMEYHKYSAIPILSRDGKYVGTLQDGDLLWFIKEHNYTACEMEKVKIKDIKTSRINHSISINTDMKDVIYRSISQSFIPVVDDNQIFIGIVRRQEIISYCYKELTKTNQKM